MSAHTTDERSEEDVDVPRLVRCPCCKIGFLRSYFGKVAWCDFKGCDYFQANSQDRG